LEALRAVAYPETPLATCVSFPLWDLINKRIADLKAEPQPSTEPEQPDLEQARRDYKFRLPAQDEERCHNCVHSTLRDGGGAHCRRLDIVVACSRTSRCPVHEPEQPEDDGEREPSLVQCNHDDPDIIPNIVDALDGLDSRVRKLEGRR
jgi:hypothetical protein